MSDLSRSKQAYKVAAKHSLLPMSTKYDKISSATSVLFEVAAVTMASLYSLSCFESDIEASHWLFFCSQCQRGTCQLIQTTNLVKVSSESPELKQFVSFKGFGQLGVVEVVEAVYGVSEGVVVLFFHQKLIESLVDVGHIELDKVSEMAQYKRK